MSAQIRTHSGGVAAKRLASSCQTSLSPLLLVEDDCNIATVLSIVLDDAGFDVVWRRSIRSTKEFLASNTASVAIVDRRLPDGDGRTLIPLMRERNAGAVIVISGATATAEREATLAAGAAAYLCKPFANEDLLDLVRCCGSAAGAADKGALPLCTAAGSRRGNGETQSSVEDPTWHQVTADEARCGAV